MIQTSIPVKIDGIVYTIGYPTVGQKLEIENLKLVFSLGSYGEMVRNGHTTALEMLDLIDAVSYFSKLSPEISTKYDLMQFGKLDLQTSLKIRKAFKKYAGWLREFENEIYNSLEKDEDDVEEPKAAENNGTTTSTNS